MISVGDLRRGVAIELDGKLYSVIEYQHIKVGRGGAQVRLKLRDLREGHIVDNTFPATARWPRVRVERRSAQYLYSDGELFHFMESGTFEQVALNRGHLGDAVNFLKENMTVDIDYAGDDPIGVDLPLAVELRVEETPPGFKGDTASGGTKPARLETGATVQVPFFVSVGDVIRVDTRTSTYLERVA